MARDSSIICEAAILEEAPRKTSFGSGPSGPLFQCYGGKMEGTERIKKALEGPLKERGYDLASVKVRRAKDGVTLEIRVDRDEPIGLDDIVAVSALIDPLVDELDPIGGPYTLDVSSLGGEKPIALTRLEAYEGRYVHLHLSHPYKGHNDLEGTLVKVTQDGVTINVRLGKAKPSDIPLPRADVDFARLAIRF